MKRAPGRAVRAILRAHGEQGWVELTRRFGRSFRCGPLWVTCEPEAVRALLLERAHVETRPSLYRSLAKLPGAEGILFQDGAGWQRRLGAVMPRFQRPAVQGFAPAFSALARAAVAAWARAGRGDDLYAAVQDLGLASVLRHGLGLDPDHAASRRLAAALVAYKAVTVNPDPRARLDELAAGWSKLLDLPWVVATLRGMKRSFDGVAAALAEVLAAPESRAGSGWLDALQAAGFAGRALTAEVNHLYGAFNAVDYTATAALYELAGDREQERLLRDELRNAGPVGPEDLPRLPQTRAFLREVLRLYPVTMAVARRAGQPLPLGDAEVPVGGEVLILLGALHRHPDHWGADGDRFRPARWLERETPHPPYAYEPFLEGNRKCIGRALAEMQMLGLLAAVAPHELRVFANAAIPPLMIPRFTRALPFVVRDPA